MSLRLINAIVIGFDPWCSYFTGNLSEGKLSFVLRHKMIFNELMFSTNIYTIAAIC